MHILNYITKKRVGRCLRFNTMNELLLFVNRMLQHRAGVPYLVILDGQIIANYEYFATAYKPHASRIRQAVSEYLSGKGKEYEDYYVRF